METVQLDFLGDLKRTHTCGELRASDAGKRALVMGWVHRRRDLGGVIFIHLRDRDGVTQLVFHENVSPEVHRKAEMLGAEYVIAAEGVVEKRSPETVNPNIPTGEVEIAVDKLWILNESRTPPFPLEETVDVKEDVRLKYRFVDLRRPHMQRNIILRSKVSLAVRETLYGMGFLEIETPFMTKSTPEGARDFLVPSRVQNGSFYALPQSPQIFKQILMVSGFDKYFQIVRCFRDEDLRADRQYEFTQIDLEMSFPQQETIFEVIEPLIQRVCEVSGHPVPSRPFLRLTYDQAMRSYGIDKPDLRLPPMTPFEFEFPGFSSAMPFVAIRIPKLGKPSRKERDELKLFATERNLILFDEGAKTEAMYAEARSKSAADADDLVLVVAHTGPMRSWRPEEAFFQNCGQFRLHVGQKFADRHKLLDPTDFRFLWVVDFPMFEWDEEEQRWNAAHHPFTSVHDEDLDKLTTNPAACRAKSYDLVLNGTELGSGSIRIHRRDIQARVFSALGLSDEEAKKKFGYLLDALEYGAPPHGGIALGLDRLVMIMAGESSIREVIPFPKTARGTDLMADAPSQVSDRVLKELGIKLIGSSKT
jgi:aspartyl-tRNA synthetase